MMLSFGVQPRKYGTKASKIEYHRLIGKWLANGRPTEQPLTAGSPSLIVIELIALYFRRYEIYDVDCNGESRSEPVHNRRALKPVRRPLRHSTGG